ncbi:diguanylate cyclase domain-containing protein [Uliginosibacterium sp. sgz301328]|uniref:sensor domain-containing diguanylate cyclase n=1 Tax=Uliginosibacterium sp. sgz301328 TaxID=3243764 RepID=UPI00359D27C3
MTASSKQPLPSARVVTRPRRLDLATWIRMGAVLTVLVTVIPLLIVVDRFAKHYAERQAVESLDQIASELRDGLDRGMFERYAEIVRIASADTIVHRDVPARVQRMLERLQATLPIYAWIGVADTDGVVQAATGGLLNGADVSARPWFKAGAIAPHVGDVHEAGLLASLLPKRDEPWHFVDISAPIRLADGTLVGVIGAHLSWNWASQLEKELIENERIRRGADVWIVDRSGAVLLGPPDQKMTHIDVGAMRHKEHGPEQLFVTWPDGHRYATAVSDTLGYMSYPGLGWTVVVRQPESVVYVEFRELQAQLVMTGALVCTVFFLLATVFARGLARPLNELSRAVERYTAGEHDIEIRRQSNYHESFVLSDAIIQMIDTERQHTRELAALNASLEQRVEERTEALHEANEHLARALIERGQAEDAALRSEEQVRDILRNANVACITVDEQHRITSWNLQAQYTFGWMASEVMGERLTDLVVPPACRKDYDQLLRHALVDRGDRAMDTPRRELKLLRRDGAEFIGEVATSVVRRGSTVIITGFVHDISERKEAERALRESQRRLKTITDNLPVLIGYVDTDLRYGFANQAYHTVFGIDPADIIGRKAQEVLVPDTMARVAPYMDRAGAGEQVQFENVIAMDGTERYLLTTYIPHVDEATGKVLGFYTMGVDITERKQLELRLEEQAMQDPLTGLPNRRAFMERLPQAMARARRWGKPCALMFLDLDGFKNVNDTLGHEAGDELLRQFAVRLLENVRQTDTVARLAGDEFTVLLESLGDGIDDAREVSRHIVEAMTQPFHIAGQQLTMTTSIGISLYRPDSGYNADHLLAAADEAMYAAKRAGKNGVQLAPEEA